MEIIINDTIYDTENGEEILRVDHPSGWVEILYWIRPGASEANIPDVWKIEDMDVIRWTGVLEGMYFLCRTLDDIERFEPLDESGIHMWVSDNFGEEVYASSFNWVD